MNSVLLIKVTQSNLKGQGMKTLITHMAHTTSSKLSFVENYTQNTSSTLAIMYTVPTTVRSYTHHNFLATRELTKLSTVIVLRIVI